MLRVWKSGLAGVLASLACVAAGEARAGLMGPSDHNRLRGVVEKRPMVFFVAKGPADSCGKGCNEWIAAVGTIDGGAADRFQELVAKLNGRKLPVFFHSPGGINGASFRIGGALRELRARTAVGRTEAKCRVFDKKDTVCQNKIKAGEAIEARLITQDAICFSACVGAFAGGSSRSLASGAALGVHASRRMTPEESRRFEKTTGATTNRMSDARIRQLTRGYHIEMGIDPDLFDFTNKTPHQKMYILDRNEIARFGLVSRNDKYETSWTIFDSAEVGFSVAKSVTLKSFAAASQEYSTTQFQFYCSQEGYRFLRYRRELAPGSDQPKTSIQVTFDDQTLLFRTATPIPNIETGASFLPNDDAVAKLAAAKSVVMIETREGQEAPLETKLLVAGLAAGAKAFQSTCLRPSSPPTLSSMKTVTPVPVRPGVPTWMPDTPASSPTPSPGFSPKPVPTVKIQVPR